MSGTDQHVARLFALLKATPMPPDDAEPDLVLSAFTAIAETREVILAELAGLAPMDRGDPRLLGHRDELVARDRAWLDALGRALLVVEQRIAAGRRARGRAL